MPPVHSVGDWGARAWAEGELLKSQLTQKAPPKHGPDGTSAPAPTATDYRQIVMQARDRQLTLNVEDMRRLQATYQAAFDRVARRAAQLPYEEALRRLEYARLMSDIDAELRTLATDYSALLDGAMLGTAQVAADREREIAELMGHSPQRSLFPDLARAIASTDNPTVRVQYGRLAEGAVRAAQDRYYRDGLNLSQRLYKLDAAGRQVIEDTLVQGIAEGVPSREVAKRLTEALTAAGADNPAYQAMRIARTEINNAHREAHIRSTQTEDGQTLGYVVGIKWNLSLSHPAADICDIWASHDSGLGPGVYTADAVPVDHPHGLCSTATVLEDFPDAATFGKDAAPQDVPQGQVDYYAGLGDPAAVAAQATGGA